nr:hypothetical protein [Tanacetum cinerariifolium]
MHDFLCLPEWTGSEDLDVATLNTKVLAKAEASKNNSNNEESDDDDDACIEISLITPMRFAAIIPVRGNQSGGSAPLAAEDS